MRFFVAIASVVFFVIGGVLTSHAQQTPTKKERRILRKVARAQRAMKPFRFFVFPAVFFTPETRWAGGISSLMVFKPENDTLTRNSQVLANAIYTQNDQILLTAPFQVFTKNNTYSFTGEVSFFRYPYIFGGIGNEHAVDDELEAYSASFPRMQLEAMRRLGDAIYLGANTWYQSLTMTEVERQGILDTKSVPGSRGGTTSGVGISLAWDTRNWVTSATRGVFVRLSNTHHTSLLGSDFSYDRYMLDARYYKTITRSGFVLAAQWYNEWNYGNTPFNRMAMLGGPMIMRGFQRGVFRDQRYSAAQLELRSAPIFKRINFTGFIAKGGVGADAQELTNHLRWAYGMGLRVNVIPDKRLYLRFDAGFGESTSGFYFNVGEAF